jgi:toxin CptA
VWLLGPLAAWALLACDLAVGVAAPLAVAAIAWGVRDVRRYARQAGLVLVIPASVAPVQCNGRVIAELHVRWRGPLAFLCWRSPEGRVQRRVCWPDTLDAAQRRELRLAMLQREAAPEGASVAG